VSKGRKSTMPFKTTLFCALFFLDFFWIDFFLYSLFFTWIQKWVTIVFLLNF
jgi:hypothetical protein